MNWFEDTEGIKKTINFDLNYDDFRVIGSVL